jgi:multidrug resistance efflux pump
MADSLTISKAQLRQIVFDRLQLDSLIVRFEEVKRNRANFAKAETAMAQLISIEAHNAALEAEKSKQQKKIADNHKLLEKGWKRTLVWQKAQKPFFLLFGFFVGYKIRDI